MKIAEAYVEIKGDYKKFRSELTKEGKSAGQQVAGAFAQAFAAAAFTAGVAKSINAANRLQHDGCHRTLLEVVDGHTEAHAVR